MKTILECMCGITEKMRNPDDGNGGLLLDGVHLKKAAGELRQLRKVLGLNTMQVLILTGIVQNSSHYRTDGDDIAHFLGMDYLKFLSCHDDAEELKKRGFIRIDRDGNYKLPKEVLKCLKSNKSVELEPLTGLNAGQLLSRIKKNLGILEDEEAEIKDFYCDMMNLLRLNPDNSVSSACLKYLDKLSKEEAVVFLALVYRYWFEKDDQVGWHDMSDYFDADDLSDLQTIYAVEKLSLQCMGIIEYYPENGLQNKDYFRIKDEIKEEIFADLGGIRKKEVKVSASRKIEAQSIGRKELFYNKAEGIEVARLKELLSEDRFDGVRARMKEKGLHAGFTCLFYGGPGTGKTETVYQLARESGRDIFLVDVSQIKSCWVGESEKNIKDVFKRYRDCVQEGGKIPVLLFNEADAIFGIRQQGAERAIDKMENSIQNIILQEMEDLDGILIATTNLTENLDKAFERRFLYKVRFEKPSREAKCSIWKSLLPDVSDAEVAYLAEHFDLSGGQIENVARKKTIQSILSGIEPSLEDLARYCRDETLSSHGEARKIGF